MTTTKEELVRRVMAAIADRRRRQQDVMIGYISAMKIRTARQRRRGK